MTSVDFMTSFWVNDKYFDEKDLDSRRLNMGPNY